MHKNIHKLASTRCPTLIPIAPIVSYTADGLIVNSDAQLGQFPWLFTHVFLSQL